MQTSSGEIAQIFIPVDPHCPNNDSLQVYVKDNKIYHTTMTQKHPTLDSSKFYITQVLQNKANPNLFYHFSRWGRDAAVGQNWLKGPYDEMIAIKEYEKKVKEKTAKGLYTIMSVSPEQNESETGAATQNEKKPVHDLLSLIFNLGQAANQLENEGVDTKKLPLGKLSKQHVYKGYLILKAISDAIEAQKSEMELKGLSAEFYSLFPFNFHFEPFDNFIIKTKEDVRQKLDLLESLLNVEITSSILKQTENNFDANSAQLKCEIDPIEKESKEYNMIEEYLYSTKESNNVQILEIFKLNRDDDLATYQKDVHNKMLLWYGAKLSNIVGTLSQGLKIPPPEALNSAYPFGKGIYFSDMFVQSHTECQPWNSDGIFCALLCEVALGETRDMLDDDPNAVNLPQGKHSVKGLGQTAPPKGSYTEFEEGVVIPLGKPEKTQNEGGSRCYNQYVVYDNRQIRMRYLVWLREN